MRTLLFVCGHCLPQNVTLSATLETLVVDEADLVLSFGYEDDLRRLLPHLPKVVQTFLMSATLSPVRARFLPRFLR